MNVEELCKSWQYDDNKMTTGYNGILDIGICRFRWERNFPFDPPVTCQWRYAALRIRKELERTGWGFQELLGQPSNKMDFWLPFKMKMAQDNFSSSLEIIDIMYVPDTASKSIRQTLASVGKREHQVLSVASWTARVWRPIFSKQHNTRRGYKLPLPRLRITPEVLRRTPASDVVSFRFFAYRKKTGQHFTWSASIQVVEVAPLFISTLT